MTIINKLVDFFFPVHWYIKDYYILQILLSRISPCLFYYNSFPFFDKSQHLELTRLDTYDSLTDYHRHYLSKRVITNCLNDLGCHSFSVVKNGIGLEVKVKK